ncbi:MAG: hypothetical protein WA008_07320 [Saprospiraceae bacterium]
MKFFVLLMVGAISFLLSELGGFSISGDLVKNYGSSVDSLPPEKDNIRFLQKVGDSLVYNEYWIGPLEAVSFHNPYTGEVLSTIPVCKLNPFLKIFGFKEVVPEGELDYGIKYLLGVECVNKDQIRPFLPNYLFSEIPEGVVFQNAITTCMPGDDWATAERYASFRYVLEWEPHPERHFLGSYVISLVTVLDSTGTEVYRRQFDGLVEKSLVSEDGKYLAITYTQYPENINNDNPRFRNCVDLIYLPQDRVVWKDETPLHYEQYSFQKFPANKLVIKKRKKREDAYQLSVVDTFRDSLYSKFMDQYDWRWGITGFSGDTIYHVRFNGDSTFLNISENFKVQNLLAK